MAGLNRRMVPSQKRNMEEEEVNCMLPWRYILMNSKMSPGVVLDGACCESLIYVSIGHVTAVC